MLAPFRWLFKHDIDWILWNSTHLHASKGPRKRVRTLVVIVFGWFAAEWPNFKLLTCRHFPREAWMLQPKRCNDENARWQTTNSSVFLHEQSVPLHPWLPGGIRMRKPIHPPVGQVDFQSKNWSNKSALSSQPTKQPTTTQVSTVTGVGVFSDSTGFFMFYVGPVIEGKTNFAISSPKCCITKSRSTEISVIFFGVGLVTWNNIANMIMMQSWNMFHDKKQVYPTPSMQSLSVARLVLFHAIKSERVLLSRGLRNTCATTNVFCPCGIGFHLGARLCKPQNQVWNVESKERFFSMKPFLDFVKSVQWPATQTIFFRAWRTHGG